MIYSSFPSLGTLVMVIDTLAETHTIFHAPLCYSIFIINTKTDPLLSPKHGTIFFGNEIENKEQTESKRVK